MCLGICKELVFLNYFRPSTLTEFLLRVLRTLGMEIVQLCA